MKRLLKRGYAKALQAIGRPFVGDTPPPRSERLKHWLYSLPAIHDIDALVALDVPWWTYDAIDKVEAFLAGRPKARVFEWGSGASSIWLAKRAGQVTSVEHDAEWFPIVQNRLKAHTNHVLLLVTADAKPSADPRYGSDKEGYAGQSFEAYCRAIDEGEALYDLIIVDGRARPACYHHALQRLRPGGMIVFDNTNRARYRRAIDASGAPAHHYRGLAPSLPYPDCTSLICPDGLAA